MQYDPNIHHRRSIRLEGYDYSQAGVYFVTICVQSWKRLFGNIARDKMVLNDAGRMMQTVWDELPDRFSNIALDEYIVMPNHFHGLVVIISGGNENGAATSVLIGNIVGAFKSIATNAYIRGVRRCGWMLFPDHLWHRNFYERIVRDENELNRIREYIVTNPARWELDGEDHIWKQ